MHWCLRPVFFQEGILLRKSSQVLRQACAELRASLGHKRPNTLIALERLAARLHEEYAAAAHAFASEGERAEGLLTQAAKTTVAQSSAASPSSSSSSPSSSLASSSAPSKPPPRSSSRTSTASRASIMRIKKQLGLPLDDEEEEEEGEEGGGTSPLRSGQQSPEDAFSDDDLSWLNEPASVPVRR